MRKPGRWIVIGATVVLLCSQYAAAEDELGISVRPRGGVMYPTDPDWDDYFDAFYQFGVAAKKTWGRWSLETSLDYIGAVDEWDFSATVLDTFVSADMDAWMVPWKLTATVQVIPREPAATGFSAYVGGGLGVWFYQLDARSNIEGYTPASESEEDFDIGLHGVLGAEYYFSPKIGIYAEGAYNWLEASSIHDVNIGGLSIVGGVTFRF